VQRWWTAVYVVIPILYFVLPLSSSLMKVMLISYSGYWMHFSSFCCACMCQRDKPMFIYGPLWFGYADGARAALNLAGTMLGYYPMRVLPSKTAIAPVNPTFLPRVRNSCHMTIEMIPKLGKIGFVIIF